MTSDTFLPRYGGGEYHVYYLVRQLRSMGHSVSLYTTEKGSWSDDLPFGVHRLQYRGIFSLPVLFYTLWKASKNVDILHSHYSYRLAFLMSLIAFLRSIPFVVTQHGLGLLPQAGASFWQECVFRVWRYWSMFFASSILSTSDDLSSDIRALGFGKKIVSIPNGFDEEMFLPLSPPLSSDPVLLAVRRHVPKNGIQYLLLALPSLLQQFPTLTCRLIGDGRLHQELRALASRLGIDSAVQFLGALDHSSILEHYRDAHVVVIPSTAESTSLSCIEAMAQEKIIVASRVGGLIELLGSSQERGYLVPLTEDEHCSYDAPMTLAPERIQKLSDAIAFALSHPYEAQKKASLASLYAREHYSWRTIASRTYTEVYAPLLSASSI